MEKERLLKEYFGHAEFREGQEALINALLGGRDVFGIMPTGGGKSICYQLPALMLEGVAIVVSPLISLMRDQVLALVGMGVSAAYVNSTLNAAQMRLVFENISRGKYKIVYVAPERLEAEGFAALCAKLNISLFAIDEAHCISQWGQDFRPSYLRILDFLEKLPKRPPVAAFTATATALVREDVARILMLRSPEVVITGFDRPNLNFEVLRPKNKDAALRELALERKDKCGIVYCATRSGVEKVCQTLRGFGLAATRYHAGLSDAERAENQEAFLFDKCSVMAATNAFGMGIDKSNVGYVIHYNMPKSLEAYYQEAGRAGRDGENADCVLLYSASDIQTAKFLIQNTGENEELSPEERRLITERELERLSVMTGYCKTTKCLRGYILEYFGQTHPEFCQNCGSCRASVTMRDMTTEAQMTLSCVKRARDLLGYSVGASLIAQTLAGSAQKRISELRLNTLSTYALMKNTPRQLIRDIIEYLEDEGYLYTDPQHGALQLTAASADILFNGARLEMPIRNDAQETAASGKKVGEEMENSGLYDALRDLRARLAANEGVPAYIVFSNATLADMAKKSPENTLEFMSVSGVGEFKTAKYGEIFLKAIAEYKKQQDA